MNTNHVLYIIIVELLLTLNVIINIIMFITIDQGMYNKYTLVTYLRVQADVKICIIIYFFYNFVLRIIHVQYLINHIVKSFKLFLSISININCFTRSI